MGDGFGPGRAALVIGAGLNFMVAGLHVAMPIVGAPAYLYYGRADLASLAEHDPVLPGLIVLPLAVVFAGFGFYGLSGAGVIRRLPLLRLGLLLIGGAYTLRGTILVLDLVRVARGLDYPIRQPAFSAVALAIGLLLLAGTARRWHHL